MSDIQKHLRELREELSRAIVGQEEAVEQLIVAMMCHAHALLEGYPGLAKTLMVRSLAETMDLRFSRVQGTPDLLPSDITGTYIIDESKGKREFKFQPGPVFANIVLMDEINRASPKTQSALLEAMQEHQVTIGNSTFPLEEPFFVLATQNPIEQEGTFLLPEAQRDRFMFKIKIDYPKYEEEEKILSKYAETVRNIRLKKVLSKETLVTLQDLTRQVPIANDVKRYALDIIVATRQNKKLIEYGASPRASINLILASKARALVQGRKYVSKEDVRAMAYPILRHRIITSFEAERQGMDEDAVIKDMIKK